MPENIESKKDLAHLSRLVQQKEEHAIEVKDAVRTIWGDYFKKPHIDQFPEIHELTHSIMLLCSKSKQNVDRQACLDLLDKVNRFAEIFWATKDVSTESKKSLNPPHMDIIVPVLEMRDINNSNEPESLKKMRKSRVRVNSMLGSVPIAKWIIVSLRMPKALLDSIFK